MRAQGAELILYSSAYSAGKSLQAHAINYNYYIISSTLEVDCTVFDITAREIFHEKSDDIGIFKNEIDLDRCIFHIDFSHDKLKALLNDHADDIELDCRMKREGWFTLRAKKPGISAREVAKKYNLEELSAYKMRSEKELDEMRKEYYAV